VLAYPVILVNGGGLEDGSQTGMGLLDGAEIWRVQKLWREVVADHRDEDAGQLLGVLGVRNTKVVCVTLELEKYCLYIQCVFW